MLIFAGLEDDVLSVVKFPIFRENPAFRFETLIKTSVRKRRDDRITRQINLGCDREFRSFHKHIGFILVQAEYEAALERNAMFVQAFNDAE